MKVSIRHLKEFVDFQVTTQELAQQFNLHSAEVEDAYRLVDIDQLTVGYVKERKSHPNADKLSVCEVDLGDETAQIVCGAPNVKAGQKVIVSKVGVKLPGLTIKKAKIRGVESNGMICSLVELGIDKKFVDASGIHVINEDCNPGDDPLTVLSLDDEVISLDLTPNRADLLSVMGVAYDAAAILDLPIKLKKPHIKETETPNPVSLEIETNACYSYYSRVLENVEIKPSPAWLQSRLIAMGIRPINNIVDITNYIMMETGQPLHAFDYDKLKTGRILVRQAKKGEKLITLDDKERILTENDIVITNGEKAVALGGVMGGTETEITSKTKRILLESAVFDPKHIRQTSKRLDLRSESSLRFERGVDPNRTLLALERATELFVSLAGGAVLHGVVAIDKTNKKPLEITTSATEISSHLGLNLTDEEVSRIFTRLYFPNTINNDLLTVQIPTRRKDITSTQDLVEEVGRIIGYDALPTNLPKTVSSGGLSEVQRFRRDVRNKLTGLGLSEAVTYSLVSKDRVFDFSDTNETPIEVLMPMTQDRVVLTLSPLVGLIDALSYNKARKNEDVFLFELGKRYNDEEKEVLCGALMGRLRHNFVQSVVKKVDFFDVKGVLESLFDSLAIKRLSFVPANDLKNLHPGQSAYIKHQDEIIGFIGKLHPEYERKHALEDVFVFELDFKRLFELKRPLKRIKEIPKFPGIERDLAIVVHKSVTAGQIIEIVKHTGKRMLKEATVFDVYYGPGVDEDQKSVAIKLLFQDENKTLEANEVDQRVNQILGALKASIKAELR